MSDAPPPGQRLWSEATRGLQAYVPGEQPRIPDLVKLNTNENPWPPSPAVLEAIRAATGDALRLYPDPAATELRDAVARRHGLDRSRVFAGNGSDEVLALAFAAFFRGRPPIAFADVTYSFYPVWCALHGIPFVFVRTGPGFVLRVDDVPADAGGVVVANPNSPTGRALPRSELRRLLESSRERVVIVDEAYVDFGGESAVPLLDEFDHLLVVHTFSKSRSLAGLRVGVALGHPDLVAALERVKGSFNSYPLDRLAQAAAVASLSDDAWFERHRTLVIEAREALAAALRSRDFEVVPSSANFLFVRHRHLDAAGLQLRLRDRGILVRRFAEPAVAHFLRITVGTPAQMDRLVEALDAILVGSAG